ncbi:cytochrome P450 [Frankia sp. AgKG'84/4]|uniref:cytochrome P450 n=1 Tax=Frankia sp. AgKG'84/4 TaxID=573490 RepID=UPI00200E8A40|nr:cytochrome P450 [Frankia sp. AgKG'84/4]MCL9795639.1 cytochrome P450 [Frankia sp. AgKG'84/4]
MTEAPEVPLQYQRTRLDPSAALLRARDEVGVTPAVTPFGAPAHLVSRYADVRGVLADTTRYSNAYDQLATGDDDGVVLSEAEVGRLRAGNLVVHDPPDHTRLRRILMPEFTVRRMRRLEPRITRIVEDALDAMQRAGRPADLVAGFALPVPSLVICELLGVPYDERDEFQARSRAVLDSSRPPRERAAGQLDMRRYLRSLVERAQADPGEDILGMLVREHGDEVSTDELAGIATLLLVAGHETTANMIGLATVALLRHPDQLARVRDDPDALVPAIEELLRWLAIVPFPSIRRTRTDVEIAGRRIAAGEHVVVSLSAANRDPVLIDDPDRLDITRGAPGHLAFGYGVHHCLGAPLARLELRVALPALLRRFPDLALAVPFENLRYRTMSIVYGLVELPVTW